MNVADAAYATVHDYPGGIGSLAPRLNTTEAVLRNKVNPKNPRNLLRLDEADLIMGLSGDYRILQALAAEHGFGLVALGEPEQVNSVTSQILQLGMAEGALSREIHDALVDGVISPNEARRIAEAGLQEQSVLIALLSRLRASTKQGASLT